jgi:large subunit ribosomal protein L9
MAQAILLQDVDSLGERGQAVDVSPGYLRNYLIPRKLAQPATPGALEEAQRRREIAEKAERVRAEREAQAAGLLGKTVLTIHQRAGEDGKLFGSVGAKEIADALRDARDLRIEKKTHPTRAAAARSRHLHGRDRACRRHRRHGQDDHLRGEVGLLRPGGRPVGGCLRAGQKEKKKSKK